MITFPEEKIIKPDESISELNYGINMIEQSGGFRFGTDALLLSAFIKPGRSGKAADFGAGCGAVSLLCAASGKLSHITAFEVQAGYADICERNAALNGFAEIITVENSDLRCLGDGRRKFRIIFTNPPYMKVRSGKSSADAGRNAARHEVMGGIEDFCRSAAASLDSGGMFYAVYRPDRLTDLLSPMRSFGLEPKRICFVQSDEKHSPSLVLVEAMRGGKSSSIIMPTLLLNDADGQKTERAIKVFETLELYE